MKAESLVTRGKQAFLFGSTYTLFSYHLRQSHYVCVYGTTNADGQNLTTQQKPHIVMHVSGHVVTYLFPFHQFYLIIY